MGGRSGQAHCSAAQDGAAQTRAKTDVRRFLKQVAEASWQPYKPIGLGEDLRLEAPGLSGGALVVDGSVVHLAAFAEHEAA